jgi:hypothetical protein
LKLKLPIVKIYEFKIIQLLHTNSRFLFQWKNCAKYNDQFHIKFHSIIKFDIKTANNMFDIAVIKWIQKNNIPILFQLSTTIYIVFYWSRPTLDDQLNLKFNIFFPTTINIFYLNQVWPIVDLIRNRKWINLSIYLIKHCHGKLLVR